MPCPDCVRAGLGCDHQFKETKMSDLPKCARCTMTIHTWQKGAEPPSAGAHVKTHADIDECSLATSLLQATALAEISESLARVALLAQDEQYRRDNR